MRLIDADAILKRAEESFKNAGLHGDDYRKFKKWLRTAPTIDAVKVVRCKDCRYRKKVGTSYYCELDEFNVKDEDFCSWGERRE
jgi:hypothetical protein